MHIHFSFLTRHKILTTASNEKLLHERLQRALTASLNEELLTWKTASNPHEKSKHKVMKWFNIKPRQAASDQSARFHALCPLFSAEQHIQRSSWWLPPRKETPSGQHQSYVPYITIVSSILTLLWIDFKYRKQQPNLFWNQLWILNRLIKVGTYNFHHFILSEMILFITSLFDM